MTHARHPGGPPPPTDRRRTLLRSSGTSSPPPGGRDYPSATTGRPQRADRTVLTVCPTTQSLLTDELAGRRAQSHRGILQEVIDVIITTPDEARTPPPESEIEARLADPDWVAREFAAIVAANWAQQTRSGPTPRPPTTISLDRPSPRPSGRRRDSSSPPPRCRPGNPDSRTHDVDQSRERSPPTPGPAHRRPPRGLSSRRSGW